MSSRLLGLCMKSYNLRKWIPGDIDTPMTFDWTANVASGWTIPIGMDADNAFSFGSRDIGLQYGAYDGQKELRSGIPTQLTTLFPNGR